MSSQKRLESKVKPAVVVRKKAIPKTRTTLYMERMLENIEKFKSDFTCTRVPFYEQMFRDRSEASLIKSQQAQLREILLRNLTKGEESIFDDVYNMLGQISSKNQESADSLKAIMNNFNIRPKKTGRLVEKDLKSSASANPSP